MQSQFDRDFIEQIQKQRAEIDRQVQEMLKNNIIEPSNSEWSSPVVLVKKKCGTFRFTIYFRQVIKVTKPEIFLLPRLDDMLDSIGEANAKYFRLLTWLVHFVKFHLRTVLSQNCIRYIQWFKSISYSSLWTYKCCNEFSNGDV